MIPFNKPYITGKELEYIRDAVESGKISGNGKYTVLCHNYFQRRWGFYKSLLTTSCTDALEMCALLIDVKPGDEVIVPSFTFVSSALAFVRQGAKIIFADSHAEHPGIDENSLESLITNRTRAIVAVHYAGVACDMEIIMNLADKYNLYIIEDAAHSINSFYIYSNGTKKPLGSIGNFGTFSFHETKNIQCGEGGLLTINDQRFHKRSEIIWEKGTNRAEFFRGEVNKYGWVDTGSSFLASDVAAAFLFAQLENLDVIQEKRLKIWNTYYHYLEPLEKAGLIKLPVIPEYAENNAHLFYLLCNTPKQRTYLIAKLKQKGIMAVFHYQSLHRSSYYKDKHDGRLLVNSDFFSDCLLRFPIYFGLTEREVEMICYQVLRILKL